MKFIQLVEFSTDNIDEMRALANQYDADTEGTGVSSTASLCADKDTPGRYIVVAEFDSHEDAMKNSEDPRTQALAAKMGEVAGGSASFRNLDVLETWSR